LLTYYVRSREVNEEYDALFSLLVADRIKATLPETCLNHILTVEGNSWLKCDELANTIDIYFANDGRPKSGSLSYGSKPVNTQSSQSRKSQNMFDVHSNVNVTDTISFGATNASQRSQEFKSLKLKDPTQQQTRSV